MSRFLFTTQGSPSPSPTPKPNTDSSFGGNNNNGNDNIGSSSSGSTVGSGAGSLQLYAYTLRIISPYSLSRRESIRGESIYLLMSSIDVRAVNEGSIAILVLVIVLTAYVTYYHVEIYGLGIIYYFILISIFGLYAMAVLLVHRGLADRYYYYRHRRMITILVLLCIATIVYAYTEGSKIARNAGDFAVFALFIWSLTHLPRVYPGRVGFLELFIDDDSLLER
jgi:hypothetical protein